MRVSAAFYCAVPCKLGLTVSLAGRVRCVQRMLLAFGKTVRQAGADFAYVRQVSVVPASQMVGRPAPSEHTGAEMANGHSSSGANGAGGSVYNDADVIAALSELAARPGQLASGAASGAVAPISSVQN